jgi:tetratricopeptide (TPR) repeat protein
MAVRRFMLYDVFLHELGHLQVVDEKATSVRRKFAMETKAQQFAMYWCKRLWSEPFDHPDPVHNPPTKEEMADKDPEMTDLLWRIRQKPDDVELLQRLDGLYRKGGKIEQAKVALEKAIALAPNNAWTNFYLGNWYFERDRYSEAIPYFLKGIKLLPKLSIGYWCLAEAYGADGQLELADKYFRMAVKIEPSDKSAARKLNKWLDFYLPIKDELKGNG